MKNKLINIFQGITLFALVASLMVVTSCEDDDPMGSTPSETTLLSFGPSGVNHGDEIVFIGHHLDRVSSIVFQPEVEVTSDAFVSRSSTQITVAVPQAAEAGTVILNSSDGAIESKSPLSFEVEVEITSITGEVKPGNNLTISGDKINWIESITFPADIVVEAADFVSQSLTELVVTVPMEAQSGFLIFASGGTEPLTFAYDEETVITLPTVSGLDPSSVRHTANLTINGTDLDLITEVVFPDGDAGASVLAADFVSQSTTAIVVAVPATAVYGPLTLIQASPVDVPSGDLTIVLPIGTASSPSPAVPGVDNLTITGTDLDLVATLTLPGSGDISTFVSQSATEIVLALPAGAESGGINYTTIHGFAGNLGTTVVVPGEGPAPLTITMFDEEIAFGGGNWSWGGTADFASTESFFSGSISAKFTEDGTDGGISVGGMAATDVTSTEVFSFSVYGGPGTGGLQLAAVLGDDTGDVWGNYNSVTIVEGEWTTYDLDLATAYPDVNLASVQRWILKPEGTSGGEVIYVDRVGFGDPFQPAPLMIDLYDETANFGGGDWSWGAESTDLASTDQAYSGDVSFRHTQSGTDGGMSVGGMSGIDASSATVFAFSLYGGPGTDGMAVAAVLGADDADVWGNYNSVNIVEGEWTEYEIDLSNYPDVNLSNVTRFILKLEGTAGGEVMYADRVGFN